MKAVAAFLLVLCYLAGSHAWNCGVFPGLSRVVQVDAGLGKVVAVTKYNQAYFLSGKKWYSLSTISLKHVSVGPAGLWGASPNNKVYKYICGNFQVANGQNLQQVDAGGDHQVVGVGVPVPYFKDNVLVPNKEHSVAERSLKAANLWVPPPVSFQTYCLRDSLALLYKGASYLSWTYVSKKMRYYSCSPNNGCWGVDTNYQVYVAENISPSSCGTSGWTYVPGKLMTMIEVSTDGSVFGVTKTGQVYQRLGISSNCLHGTTWRLVKNSNRIRHLSYDLGCLWLVTTSGSLLRCTH